jgi:tetratricopeptide (TPR) repeat protein
LPTGEKKNLCRIIAQAGMNIPGAAAILEKLLTDESESVRVSAVVAAAMNELPLAMSELSEPESHQMLFVSVNRLNEDAWKIVESSNFTAGQYADALRMARAASDLKSMVHPELQSGVSGVENTLGVALYRNEQYEKAILMLQKSIELQGDNPADAAYLAMVHHKLGQKEEFQKDKAHFEELLKKEEWLHSADALNAQKELNAVLKEPENVP